MFEISVLTDQNPPISSFSTYIQSITSKIWCQKNIKSTSRWQRLQQQHNFLQVRVLSAVVYLAYAAGYFLATALQDGPPFPNRAVTISETPGGVGIGDGICFSPPARWGSLDFNQGATPPPFTSSASLLSWSPLPVPVQRVTPGPELHIASYGCCWLCCNVRKIECYCR